jgi:acetyl-CoA acetyltransferase
MSVARGSAVVGIGATEFSKNSGRSELRLAIEASRAAISDAGLRPADIDGMVAFSMEDTPDATLAEALGVPELGFFSRVHYGGGATGGVLLQAALAVTSGLAGAVLCYRAFNERSGIRFGAGSFPGAATERVAAGWYRPHGLLSPAARMAIVARRYMWEFGAASEDFARVAVVARRHAATNPSAWFYQRPITVADHQASRLIADPLRLLDCCQETDGGVAVVVTSLERARDLPHPPAVIAAAAQGISSGMAASTTSYYREPITWLPEVAGVAGRLWRMSGCSVDDVDIGIFYDHFTPYVLLQLEAYGFCPRGEARHYIADGNLELTGKLPFNPHGGQLGEAYLHGMNGVTEAVRQIRGTAVNQVPAPEHVLVTAGPGLPTSAALLAVDR